MVFRHNIAEDKKIQSLGGVFTYIIKISTYSPQRIRIKVSDAIKPNTYYHNRYKTVNGEATFYLRMPQSPRIALFEITNEGAYGGDYYLE